ncbi:MAG: protein phosphatase 2C domain-containing protein [Ruminococcus sp.]|nr:protein phosphatase 2C domain-containing protein [Ruminococcus sp.]
MWKAIQCAVQGRSHIKNFVPCQDKTFYSTGNNTTVTALADGAGSAKLSHFGAEHITKFICDEFVENFDLYFSDNDGVAVKKELDSKIKNQISALAEELNCDIHDLSSTLLMVAVNNNRYIILHIGDGIIGYSKNNELKVATLPENGEFANTTVFTTSGEALHTMKLLKGNLGDIDGFVLMSDGTQASLYNKRQKKLADVLSRIMKFLSFIPAEIVEEQLTYSFYSLIREATTDDCSIVIMADTDDSFRGYFSMDSDNKKRLLDIKNSTVSDKLVKRYDDILSVLETPQSLKKVSKQIHLKPKYTKKHLSKLIGLNLVEQHGSLYQTIIIL